jgi:hypothetical protein
MADSSTCGRGRRWLEEREEREERKERDERGVRSGRGLRAAHARAHLRLAAEDAELLLAEAALHHLEL